MNIKRKQIILECFAKNTIALELSKTDKISVLGEMLLALAENNKILFKDVSELHKSLFSREQFGATCVAGGVAIPHKQHPCVTGDFIAFGRSVNGVNWGSSDGKPTHLVFLVIGPVFSSGTFLQIIALIAKLTKNELNRQKLLSCKIEDFYDVIIDLAE